jgi:hypothetical protein
LNFFNYLLTCTALSSRIKNATQLQVIIILPQLIPAHIADFCNVWGEGEGGANNGWQAVEGNV